MSKVLSRAFQMHKNELHSFPEEKLNALTDYYYERMPTKLYSNLSLIEGETEITKYELVFHTRHAFAGERVIHALRLSNILEWVNTTLSFYHIKDNV
jgi:hypothetical protein